MIAPARSTRSTTSTTCYALAAGLRGGVFVCVEPAHDVDEPHRARGLCDHVVAVWYGSAPAAVTAPGRSGS